MSESAVPRLDLAPKLSRPLSLWNPLDYLRLVYWVFFFPQAIRWYVERFGSPSHQDTSGGRALLGALRQDPVQRLCWELVNRWNERFLAEGEKTPRTLTLADLEPVLTPDLYHAAAYYFDGVWSNITAAERDLLRVMAEPRDGGWTLAELAAAAHQSRQAIGETLKLLQRHDVIAVDARGIRFAAELMRRWVADGAGTPQR